MNNVMKEFKQKTSQNGLKVFLITALVLIGIIVLNLLVGLLPKSITEIDISADKMYSVSDSTKRSLSKLDNKVEIYLLVSGGEGALADEGLHTKSFLDKFGDYNKNLSFEVIDTASDPTFTTSLGITEEVGDLSVIVKSDKRTRVLAQSDLFYYYIDGVGKLTESEAQQYAYMMQMYGQSVTPVYYFDGENQMLSAVDYVTTDNLPIAYVLDGHSEIAIGTTLSGEFTSHNIVLSTLTLMKTGAIPEDCSLLIINCPKTDLTESEAKLILTYLEEGGKLLLITEPEVAEKTNLLSVAEAYGLTATDGIVIEGDSNHYNSVPYYLFPAVGSSHSVTSEYASSTYVFLPFAHAINIAETLPTGVCATGIFKTTESSYIIPVDAKTTDRPEGQNTAEYNVGVVAESENGAQIVWISSYGITDESANSYSASGNFVYTLSAVKWMCKETGITSISPLAMSTPRLVVSSASAGVWSVILIFLIPIGIFGCGLIYWVRRRKR